MPRLYTSSIFAIALSLLMGSTVLAEDPFKGNFEGIEVFGRASVEVNDIPVLKIAIVEQGVTAYKTSLLVKQKTTQIMDALLSAGINKQEIQTSAIRINTINDRTTVNVDQVEVFKIANDHPLKVNTKTTNKKHNAKRKLFIEASRYLLIELKEEGIFERVYDDAVKYGAADISRVETSGDIESFYSQALTQALDNARSKAQDLALRMNAILGDVVMIQELAMRNVHSDLREGDHKGASSDNLKNKAVSAEVKVRFEVK